MRKSLLFCSVMVSCAVLAGCQRSLTPDSGVASRVDSNTDRGIPPTGGAASPPGTYRKARLTKAMRGLTYDSGRVEIDRKAVGKIVRGGTIEQATASFEQGEELLEHNQRVEAIEAFTRAVLIAPGEAVFYEGLGRALMYKGLGKEAEAAFRSALDRAPDFLDGRIQLAVVMQMQARQEEVNRAWRDVLALSPDHLEAHMRLAIGLYYLHDFATAWEHVHTVEGLGDQVPPQFRVLLARRMPEPSN